MQVCCQLYHSLFGSDFYEICNKLNGGLFQSLHMMTSAAKCVPFVQNRDFLKFWWCFWKFYSLQIRKTTTENVWMQWASYQIHKICGCACAGNAGNVFPRRRLKRKPLVSDPGMHHGTCVTHVPWCMSGSLTCGDGENVPGIPGACAPAILRIWQEAH